MLIRAAVPGQPLGPQENCGEEEKHPGSFISQGMQRGGAITWHATRVPGAGQEALPMNIRSIQVRAVTDAPVLLECPVLVTRNLLDLQRQIAERELDRVKPNVQAKDLGRTSDGLMRMMATYVGTAIIVYKQKRLRPCSLRVSSGPGTRGG
jgi:hypothetical protein